MLNGALAKANKSLSFTSGKVKLVGSLSELDQAIACQKICNGRLLVIVGLLMVWSSRP